MVATQLLSQHLYTCVIGGDVEFRVALSTEVSVRSANSNEPSVIYSSIL